MKVLDLSTELVVLDWVYEPTLEHVAGLITATASSQEEDPLRQYAARLGLTILERPGFGPLTRPTFLPRGHPVPRSPFGLRRAAVPEVTPLASAGESGHHAVGIHSADAVSLAFADVGVAPAVHANGPGAHYGGFGGGASVPAPRLLSVAGKGCDYPGAEVQVPYSLVLDVCNEQSAPAVQKTVVWLP